MRSPTAPDPRMAGQPTPPGADAAILLEEASVSYRVPREPIGSFKEYAIRLLQRRLRMTEYLALKRVSLDIRKGETFGVVGRNGAGKSTLLKLVARILQPTGGRVRVAGAVAPLLDISGGFHPELTGRENVFLNGAMLGFSTREMRRRFESIARFAELGDFIEAPVRTYSSGMIARLGFAIATDVEPDILLIDEVLAVGDEKFRAKCADRMRRFREGGATIVLVSHDLQAVRDLCGRAVWLNQGQVEALGPVEEVVARYGRS
jgi:ABC-type polysaccharide/polyol phosphate transport system ATPase subunit